MRSLSDVKDAGRPCGRMPAAAAAAACWVVLWVVALHGWRACSRPAPVRSAAIAITADSGDFLQSCGCGGSPSLGLAQRASLLHGLHGRLPGLVVLDAGNLGAAAWKAAVALDALDVMGYGALALQPADEALARSLGWPGPGSRLELVRENDPVRWVGPGAAEQGGGRIAVVSGTWWRKALPRLAQSLAEGTPPDVLVCLGRPAEGQEAFLAAARQAVGPRCAVILAGAGVARPDEVPPGVAVVPIVPGGKTVCLVSGGREGDVWSWRTEVIPVGAELPADAKVKALIDRSYAEQQQAFLAAQRSGPSAGSSEGDGVRLAVETGYVPAFGCRNCHADAFTKWQHSRHARAVETLAQKQRLVPECLACHSEEFRRTGRLRAAALLGGGSGAPPEPMDGSIECASCHGPRTVHAALGTKGDPEHAKPVPCTECHDAERSPNFDPAAYQARIRH